MSIRIMAAVWDSPCRDPQTLLLLLALADWCNENAECWPSVPSLAHKTRQSERNCRLHLRRLEALGVLDRLEGRGRNHTNQYFLNLQNLQNLQLLLPPLQVKRGENLQVATSKPATIVAPEPLVDPSLRKISVNNPPTPFQGDAPVGENGVAPAKKKPQRKPTHATSSPEALAVRNYLNTVNSRRYTTATQIDTLLRTGVTVEDCRLVIDFGYAVLRQERPDWYEQYFDNVTPFRQVNFDKYRARAEGWAAHGRRSQNTTTADDLMAWAKEHDLNRAQE